MHLISTWNSKILIFFKFLLPVSLFPKHFIFKVLFLLAFYYFNLVSINYCYILFLTALMKYNTKTAYTYCLTWRVWTYAHSSKTVTTIKVVNISIIFKSFLLPSTFFMLRSRELLSAKFSVYNAVLSPMGLPWWLSGRESSCQWRRHKFDPWVRKIPWRRKWQATPVFLPGKSHRQRCLAGYSSWGLRLQKELDMT